MRHIILTGANSKPKYSLLSNWLELYLSKPRPPFLIFVIIYFIFIFLSLYLSLFLFIKLIISPYSRKTQTTSHPFFLPFISFLIGICFLSELGFSILHILHLLQTKTLIAPISSTSRYPGFPPFLLSSKPLVSWFFWKLAVWSAASGAVWLCCYLKFLPLGSSRILTWNVCGWSREEGWGGGN